MGLFGKKKTQVETPKAVEQKKEEKTVIGQGITFVGTFTTDELIDIRGKVEGKIISPKEVLVSKTGKHEGTMDVEYLTVDGTIDSEIYCRNTITLRDDCDAYGTLKTPKLNAEKGSNFHGELILEKHLLDKEVPTETKAEAALDSETGDSMKEELAKVEELVEFDNEDSEEDAPITAEDIFGWDSEKK